VRVIDTENNQLGVLETNKALELAKEKRLDLVEVSPKENPPVCRIMDYGKYRYWEEKKEHKHRVSQKKSELKTIRLSFKISDHDLGVKAHRAEKFLKQGHKVQPEMLFRGRENIHVALGEKVLQKFQDLLKDSAEIEKPPEKKGMILSMILKPKDNDK
jgi:translation initiation factor IF-3